jgi:pyroglutamyl-peptidase
LVAVVTSPFIVKGAFMPKILVTGFEAFAGNQMNPTQDLINSIEHSDSLQALVLPVSFEKSWPTLEHRIAKMRPDWVISFGVAAKRQSIDLERVALNFMDASVVDNEGKLIEESVIHPDLPACFINDLPLNEWRRKLSTHYPVNVSLTAGSFVCNHLYFQLLTHRQKYDYRTLFIHIPYADESFPQSMFEDFLKSFIEILNRSC